MANKEFISNLLNDLSLNSFMILGPDRQKGKKGEEKYRDKIERDYLHRNTIAQMNSYVIGMGGGPLEIA